MDLPFAEKWYDARSRNGWHHGAPTKKYQGCKRHAALSHNVRRLRRRPVRTLCSAAFHFTIHPVEAWKSTAHLVIEIRDSLCGVAIGIVDGIESRESQSYPPCEKEVHDRELLDASTSPRDCVTIYGVVRNKEHERRARCERLRWQLENATDVRAFIKDAEELYKLDGEDQSEDYDVELLKEHLQRMRKACDHDDLAELLRLIKTQVSRDIGGIDNPRLFPESHSQTQPLITQYIQIIGEVVGRIIAACALDDERLDKAYVRKEVLQIARDRYGSSALLLSGGGTLGMSHIGVVKTLLWAKALPRIICGSSAGAIVCSVLGTHKNSEIEDGLHVLCRGDLAVFVGPDEEQGFLGRYRHYRENGHVFDPKNLQRVMRRLYKNITFREAYNRTGRILNITVSSSSKHGKPRLLNYQSAPNVVIWSAVVASCAVPFFYKPARLVVKDEQTSDLEFWRDTPTYADGSLDGDIPCNELSADFNVNLAIVSQTNPHVIPFIEDEYGIPDRLPIGFVRVLNEAGTWAKSNTMRLMQSLINIGLYEYWGSKMHSVLGQRYTGDITILPVTTFADYPRILMNPTPEFMERATRNGERATWLKLNMIKQHVATENVLDRAVHAMNEIIAFGPTESRLRRESIRYVQTSQTRGRPRARHRRSSSITTTINSWPGRILRASLLPNKIKLDASSGLLDNASIEATGVPSPSESDSSSTLFSRASEDDEAKWKEGSETSPPPAEPVPFASQPNSPRMMPKSFFDSPPMIRLPARHPSPASDPSPARAKSPVPLTPALGASLTMTPSSPEQRYRQRFNSVAPSESPALTTASKYAPRQFGGEAHFPVHLALPEPRRHRRRYSAGIAELDIDL